ncbi:MAG: hypothetical protein QOF68_1736 [Gaiellales bacterium]|nr:hypothetical protein [Gaiellales bacterium]
MMSFPAARRLDNARSGTSEYVTSTAEQFRAVSTDDARHPAIEALARVGFVARGLLYVVVAVLAVEVARGHHTSEASQKGALREVAAQPFGFWLIAALAIGFGGYALWRLISAGIGRMQESGEKKSVGSRLAAFGSGMVYGSLCIAATSMLLGSGGTDSESDHIDRATTFLMDISPWIVLAAGATVVGVGAYQAFVGLSGRFMKHFKKQQMSARAHRWARRIGAFGHIARGMSLALIGWFLIDAARDYDPKDAVGLDGALQKLATEPYGEPALLAVAFGLAAFGVFSLFAARYSEV